MIPAYEHQAYATVGGNTGDQAILCSRYQISNVVLSHYCLRYLDLVLTLKKHMPIGLSVFFHDRSSFVTTCMHYTLSSQIADVFASHYEEKGPFLHFG